MLNNIFRLTFRHFFRQKIYTITIILSLSIGFAIANSLIAFVIHESSTDDFHKQKNRIYRLIGEDPFEIGQQMSFLPHRTIQYINDNFPEVEETCTMYTIRNNGLSTIHGTDRIEDLVILGVDSSFFSIFNFPFAVGESRSAPGHDKIVLTTATSEKLFGKKYLPDYELEIHIDTSTVSLNVAGILEPLPHNSHLYFDALVDFRQFNTSWGGITYMLLSPETSSEQLEEKINASLELPGILKDGKMKYSLQPLRSVYWDEENSRSFSRARGNIFIWISLAVTILILFLAGFNFLNLFTVSFHSRWKEFAMKKVLGASIYSFRITAVIEVALYILLSYFVSIYLTYISLPKITQLFSSTLSVDYLIDTRIISIVGGILLLIAIIIVFRLTRYLNGINPLHLIRSYFNQRMEFNTFLVTLQLIISFILLISAIIIIEQVRLIRHKELGFNRNLLEVRSPAEYMNHQLHVLKNNLQAIPGIESISVCSGNPISDNIIARYDFEDGKFYTPYIYYGDPDHLSTLGLELISGKVPNQQNQNARLVNERFIELFELKDPIGSKIPGEKEAYIAGIVQNFICGSLKQDIPPVIISGSLKGNCLIAKMDMKRVGSIVPLFEKEWRQLYPDHPFKPIYIDSELGTKHSSDLLFGKILITSSILSILITCFGLFAISWGTSRDRLKEIGIRKVMGATRYNIFILLIKDYTKLIGISFIVASPIAYYLMTKWLENFTEKIKIHPGTFLLAGIILLLITMITITWQTVKSSRTNPVEELKYE